MVASAGTDGSEEDSPRDRDRAEALKTGTEENKKEAEKAGARDRDEALKKGTEENKTEDPQESSFFSGAWTPSEYSTLAELYFRHRPSGPCDNKNWKLIADEFNRAMPPKRRRSIKTMNRRIMDSRKLGTMQDKVKSKKTKLDNARAAMRAVDIADIASMSKHRKRCRRAQRAYEKARDMHGTAMRIISRNSDDGSNPTRGEMLVSGSGDGAGDDVKVSAGNIAQLHTSSGSDPSFNNPSSSLPLRLGEYRKRPRSVLSSSNGSRMRLEGENGKEAEMKGEKEAEPKQQLSNEKLLDAIQNALKPLTSLARVLGQQLRAPYSSNQSVLMDKINAAVRLKELGVLSEDEYQAKLLRLKEEL